MKPLDDVQSPGKGPGSEPEDASLADAAFGKLPTLGPIAWLYARTQDRRFLFLADLDWAVMPPVVLDQCRLFMRGKMPHAFVTWAHVDDEVHRRLSLGHPRLAPHEWRSGSHLWLIDVVTPFGDTQEVLADVQRMHFQGRTLRYLSRDAESQKNEVRTYAGPDLDTVHPSPSGKIVH
jgi:cytolysin-activating lysine-acyltransferase